MLNVGQSNLKSSEQAFMNRLEAKTSSLAANIVEINTPSPSTTSTSFRDENTPPPASNAPAILKQTHQIMSQFPDSHSAVLDHNQLQQSTPTKSPVSSPKISPSPTRKAISPFLSPLKEFAESSQPTAQVSARRDLMPTMQDQPVIAKQSINIPRNAKGYPTTGGKVPRKTFPREITNSATEATTKENSLPQQPNTSRHKKDVCLNCNAFRSQARLLAHENEKLKGEIARLQQALAQGPYQGT